LAFSSAPGYGNLPSGNFSPTIFSQRALKEFRKASVVEAVTNTDFYGEISNFGDTVRVILEPDITISTYTRGATPTTQDLADSEFTLTVDKANMFQFAIDDLEQKQSHVNFEELAANRAAYKIKDTMDAEVLSYMATTAPSANRIGTTSVSVRVATGATPSATVFTPLGILARLKRLMDATNIPSDNRYFIADPVFYEQLGDENSKLLDASYTGENDSPLFNGLVSNRPLRGFKLYESNNLPTGGTGPTASAGSTNYGTIIAGHMSAVAAVNQIAKTEKFRSQNRFADVVRGLHVYGRGVIRDEALFCVRYAVAA
jgi:hypothetical protein